MGRGKKKALETETVAYTSSDEGEQPVKTEAETIETETDDLNEDGLIKGQQLSEGEYWAFINKQKAKK